MIITLPRYWDQEVILARGHCNRVYVYSVQDFNKLKEEIEERKVKYGTRYEAFRKFIDMGIFNIKVSSEGHLKLPEGLLKYLGDIGKLTFGDYHPLWLEIYMDHENKCACERIDCAKCLYVHCKRDDCSTHSAHRKKFLRTRMKN